MSISNNINDLSVQLYTKLDLNSGSGLYFISDTYIEMDIDKLQWFEQARNLGAHAIYFVLDNPTALFFIIEDVSPQESLKIEDIIREIHLKVWNTSRVPMFFVLLPFEFRVYSAYQKPARNTDEWLSANRWLDRLEWVSIFRTIDNSISTYQEYTKENIDSGKLFSERKENFNRENRVDQFLLRNLGLLRSRLQSKQNDKKEHIHALIARAIFIRYLEDRKVLIPEYFNEINLKYEQLVDVLVSKEDTYDILFPKLRKEFNGNLFPYDEQESKVITQDDLLLLRDFLLGREMGDQRDIFFWAYKFDIIPVELISSIYEEFYYEKDGNTNSNDTHYTPLPLVEFVLSQTLHRSRLETNPKILDPACGSGIFLVEAFKRIVRFECWKRNIKIDELPREELTKILKERIVGIDINKQAIQVAAFSLYLAFLDSIQPKDIRKHKQLPILIYNPTQSESGTTLYVSNAFWPNAFEKQSLDNKINETSYIGRADQIRLIKQETLPLELQSFDVIIGNPPWGNNLTETTKSATHWCKAFDFPVGDRELSQCFIWRCYTFIREGGVIGLLVSSGILLKNERNNKNFRNNWLKKNKVKSVYDFSHVREFFFSKSKNQKR